MKSAYVMPGHTMQEVGLKSQLIQQFIANGEGDVFSGAVKFAVRKQTNTAAHLLLHIKGYLANGAVVMPHDAGSASVTGDYNNTQVFCWVSISEYAEAIKFRIEMFGAPKSIEELLRCVYRDFDKDRLPLIKWWFQGRHGDDTKDFYLPIDVPHVAPEYYPDIGDPEQYLADYMASDEAILLIAGPPGTGKTTLLRHMIAKYKLCAHVIYDERMMEKDGPFQAFLFGDREYVDPDDADSGQQDVMIIEDADTILSARQRDGNKLMSRFLNISDGLIKLPNKKLIFTTNITDYGTIDDALVRPGRCFGVVKTRQLNLTEAQAAARVACVPIPLEKREYSLADLFNQGKNSIVRTVGFGVRH